jgi:hypothetical protein
MRACGCACAALLRVHVSVRLRCGILFLTSPIRLPLHVWSAVMVVVSYFQLRDFVGVLHATHPARHALAVAATGKWHLASPLHYTHSLGEGS